MFPLRVFQKQSVVHGSCCRRVQIVFVSSFLVDFRASSVAEQATYLYYSSSYLCILSVNMSDCVQNAPDFILRTDWMHSAVSLSDFLLCAD